MNRQWSRDGKAVDGSVCFFEVMEMLSQKYRGMLGKASVIMELSAFAGARAKEIGAENVFDFSLGNPSVPVPKAYNACVSDLLDREPCRGVHGYSQGLGNPEARAQIAASLNRRFGMNYDPDDLFMTAGAAGALAHALRLVTQPGDEVLTIAPYFPEYRPYVELAGCTLTVTPARPDSFQIDFSALEGTMNPRVQAVLINTPNNPSGSVYSAATMERLAAFLTEKERQYGHEIWLISDEPYREILFDGTPPVYPSRFYSRTLSCYSFSKSLSIPGDRIGYLAVNPACGESKTVTRMAAQISRGIGHDSAVTVVQRAAAACCDLTADFSVYRRNRDLLLKELTDLGFSIVRPEGTFYMFPRALEDDAAAFCRKAMAYDLILVPGETFGVADHFRIAYCMETEKVERSLEAWRRFVRTEYGHGG